MILVLFCRASLKTWHLVLRSLSSAHAQLIVSLSSAHVQLIVSTSSTHLQLIVSTSSTHHQFIFNSLQFIVIHLHSIFNSSIPLQPNCREQWNFTLDTGTKTDRMGSLRAAAINTHTHTRQLRARNDIIHSAIHKHTDTRTLNHMNISPTSFQVAQSVSNKQY